MRHVLAGPFIGEFGWELFCWQGFLRKRRPDYDAMTVICRTGHGILYKDCADDIIEIDIPVTNVNMWKGSVDAEAIASYWSRNHDDFTDFIAFDTYKGRWWFDPQYQLKQKFVPYGVRNPSLGFDILMHVRNAHHCRSGFRNWRKETATEYAQWAISKGYLVACIGRSDTSLLIEGTYDRRNKPLEYLMNIMTSSRMIIGSQSGPIHLAALCGLPIVSWQTRPEHAHRLRDYWNPFNTKVITKTGGKEYWKKYVYYEPPLDWMKASTLENK